MNGIVRKITDAFGAGAFGGALNALAIWLAGSAGVMAAASVRIPYHLPLSNIYMRIVWGGVWGALFLVIPMRGSSMLSRGLLLSLGPSIVQLFYIFPYKAGKGMMGLDLGDLTPVFVLFFNAVWGVGTSLWLKNLGR